MQQKPVALKQSKLAVSIAAPNGHKQRGEKKKDLAYTEKVICTYLKCGRVNRQLLMGKALKLNACNNKSKCNRCCKEFRVIVTDFMCEQINKMV